MWAALEVAQATTSCAAMPGGLDARIEQGGTNVSGGQRQRLSIARALIRRPDIYVFDDSFSALDLATDARLRAALVPYTRDAAVVIVAQRVSTISTADNILVLEDGAVIGRGTHDELIATARPTPRSSSRRSARRARHDDHRRPRGDEELDLAAPEIARRRAVELGRRPRRAVEGLQERAAAAGPDARAACGSSSSFVARARDRQRRRSTCSARASSATRTDIIVSGVDQRRAASTSASCTTCCSRRSCCTPRRRCCRSSPSLPPRRRHPAADVQAAVRRSRTRSTCCRSATSTSSHAATCSAASRTTSTTSRRACSRR